MATRDMSSCPTAGGHGQDRLAGWAARSLVTAVLGDAGRELSPVDEHLVRTILANGPVRITDLAVWQGVDKSDHHPAGASARAAGPRQAQPGSGRPPGRAAHGDRDGPPDLSSGWTPRPSPASPMRYGDWPEEDRESFASLFGRFADDLTRVPQGSLTIPGTVGIVVRGDAG